MVLKRLAKTVPERLVQSNQSHVLYPELGKILKQWDDVVYVGRNGPCKEAISIRLVKLVEEK